MRISKRVTRRGSALLLSMPLLLLVCILGIAAIALTSGSSRISNRAWMKTQSDALAEAGVHSMYAQMTNVPANSNTVNTANIGSTSLSGNVGAGSFGDGSFSATVISSTTSMVNGQQTYTYVIEGTGLAANGKTTSKSRATFTMTRKGMSSYTLGDDAIRTAGNVNMSGGSFTLDPAGGHSANVTANGTITDSSAGLTIDGLASYGSSSNLAGKARSTSLMSSLVSFPDATTTAGWRSTWLTQAQEPTSTKPTGNIVNGNLSYSVNGALTAPAYISGNLTVSGGHTLTINVDPTATKPCVVFVHGTVNISGGSSLVNNGVLLVSDGTQTFSGTSAVYSAIDMVNCGLISFSPNLTSAITISGGSGVAKVGVIYAVNGGATLSGGSVFQGSLTAGGVGSTVTLSGGSSVDYQSGWNTLFGPFAPGYTSSGLGHWVRTY